MMRRRGGFLLLIHMINPNKWAHRFLERTIILFVVFSFWATLEATFGDNADASLYCLRATGDFLTIAFCLLASISEKGDRTE